MKIVWFVFRNSKKKHREKPEIMKPSIKIERFLFIAFIITFSAMIFVQAGMMNESVRTFLIRSSNYDGVPLKEDYTLYDEGELVLELVSGAKNTSANILINGEKVGSFESKILIFPVKNNDLVQVDSSASREPVKVRILTKSDNIKTECEGKQVEAFGNIKELVRIMLK